MRTVWGRLMSPVSPLQASRPPAQEERDQRSGPSGAQGGCRGARGEGEGGACALTCSDRSRRDRPLCGARCAAAQSNSYAERAALGQVRCRRPPYRPHLTAGERRASLSHLRPAAMRRYPARPPSWRGPSDYPRRVTAAQETWELRSPSLLGGSPSPRGVVSWGNPSPLPGWTLTRRSPSRTWKRRPSRWSWRWGGALGKGRGSAL